MFFLSYFLESFECSKYRASTATEHSNNTVASCFLKAFARMVFRFVDKIDQRQIWFLASLDFDFPITVTKNNISLELFYSNFKQHR